MYQQVKLYHLLAQFCDRSLGKGHIMYVLVFASIDIPRKKYC